MLINEGAGAGQMNNLKLCAQNSFRNLYLAYKKQGMSINV